MNDEFLHHLRTAPTAQFAAALKARLDRQPYRPPTARPGSRRFTVGIALLLGAATFALALVLSPELRALMGRARISTPVMTAEPVASIRTHRPLTAPPRAQPGVPHKRAGQESLPTLPGEVAGTTAAEPRAPDDSDVRPLATPAEGTVPVQPISIITAHELYELTHASAVQFTRDGRYPEPRLAEGSASQALARFCGPSASARPDLISTARRMRAGEYQSCRGNGSGELSESKMPYRTAAGTLTLYVYIRQGGPEPVGFRDFLRTYWLALVAEAERPTPAERARPDLYFFDALEPEDLQP